MASLLRVVCALSCMLHGAALADHDAPLRTVAFAGGVRSHGGADPGRLQHRVDDASEWRRATRTEWHAVELNRRKVLDGTMITIAFDGDGRVSGNAGTNNYMGSYERQGSDGLLLSLLSTTKKYLDYPPGRMEQEARYLDALNSTDSFTMEGDELVLWAGAIPLIRYASAPRSICGPTMPACDR